MPTVLTWYQGKRTCYIDIHGRTVEIWYGYTMKERGENRDEKGK